MSSAPVTTASLLKMKRQGEKIAALTCYDASFTQRLRALQSAYLKDCDTIDRQAWMSRRFAPRFVENAFRLVSPLL